VDIVLIPDGEKGKSYEAVLKAYAALEELRADRRTLIVGLGGGTVTDVAGFIASTYLRGLPLAFIPTTLLAQADSSIGGKNGINLGGVKNRVGTFYQPDYVFSDLQTLTSLPSTELCNGMAEVIKHAVIADKCFFEFSCNNAGRIRGMDMETLESVVVFSVGVKKKSVEEDERDTNSRAVLNLGHTVGHAIEAASDFRVPHGCAVSVGIVAACKMASRMGMIKDEEFDRIMMLLSLFLPVSLMELKVDKEAVVECLRGDKKAVRGGLRMVIPQGIGKTPIIQPTSASAIREVL